MIYLDRFVGNPILEPNQINPWEAEAAFNGSIIKEGNKFFLLYRAQSKLTIIDNKKLEVSTIGCTESIDRIHFENRKQFIKNEQTWEKFGCEDPRITKIGNKFYIFYTALSNNPPKSQGIKVAVAISSDMQVISEKHLVTPFNAKAMALFPEKINDKFVAILTVNTDMPPAKIALVYFDDESQIWDHNFWNNWYKNLDQHALPLLRNQYDHLEVGAVPLKTIFGWLLIYCYIKNYQSSNKTFGIEAVLLDLNNPAKILGRSENPLLVPEKKYELFGKVPNVIFPSGSLIYNQTLGVYYGAADTTCCLAACDLNQLLEDLLHQHVAVTFDRDHLSFRRYSKNPIINPILEHEWENKYTLNPAAVYLDNKVHLLYRAMGKHNTSVLGYASSQNGVHIDERLSYPVYLPREDFERKLEPGNSGCEDPRLTVFGNTLYMCYTAYDSKNPTRVALTSISTSNFCNKNWQWSRPILISPPGMNDKNACLLPEKISNHYVFFHRLHSCIWIDYVDDLNFGENKWLGGHIILRPQPDTWYSEKIGIAAPPLKTNDGWLLIFHGLSKEDLKYRLGAALLNIENPALVEALLPYPLLEPKTKYENSGLRSGTVFACGAVILGGDIFVYYGAADQYIAVASLPVNSILKELNLIIKHH